MDKKQDIINLCCLKTTDDGFYLNLNMILEGSI